jgi:metallo-beta-lactamase family protein
MSLEIQFLGAAGTVTGSKYLVIFKNKKYLIDCGLFQGLKSLRLKNWESLPIDVSEIDAVILTHAHIDHSGYIPRLIQDGFSGKIYCTHATKDLCAILLPDSGYLMEEEAEYLNRKKKTKHQPAKPLYTQNEALASLDYFQGVKFEEQIELDKQFKFEFRYAGHILGAASVILQAGEKKIAFTGDVGRQNDAVFYPPKPLPPVDYLITESTYGNRLHKKINVLDELEKIIMTTYKRKGVILIPSFAVGRAQSFMYHLLMLKRENRIPNIPMYLNSPMATNVNGLLTKYKELHRLSDGECVEVCSIVKYVRSVEESIALNEKKGPMIIISASGMLSGGRVLHHLKAFAPFQRNTILLAGYQAAGTRGEALERGAPEIKVHGEYVPVRAQIANLDNVSAHADYSEMITWFSQSALNPKKVFITHGELSAADDFRRRLFEKFKWDCVVPEQDKIFKLG